MGGEGAMSLVLEIEGKQPHHDPTPKVVERELRKLRSYGKSSFASLTRKDGSYLQVAGGGVGCLLERRSIPEQRHFRAFVVEPRVPFEDGTELVFGGGRIKLMRDEWLDIGTVTKVFLHFLTDPAASDGVQWRDVTATVWPEVKG